MACEFSAPFLVNARNSTYSPSSILLASASGSQLCVRDSASLEIQQMFSCVDRIDKIEFSPDSCYILCGIYCRSTIQVFCVADPQWRCRINESVAGIVSVSWSPDSRHIIVESDFGIQLAIWSLTDNVSYIIQSPKEGGSNFSFSDCGRYGGMSLQFLYQRILTSRYLAVGHRFECKDHIGVYSTNPWSELNKFRTRTTDLVNIQWTPAGTHILVQDSHLCYRILVYTPAGEVS